MTPFQKGIYRTSNTVQAFIFHADYIVFTYEFTNGTDLDTRTRVVTPDIGQNIPGSYLGWGQRTNQPQIGGWSQTVIPIGTILDWAGDNTGQGFESVMLNVGQLVTNYPGTDTFVIDLRCMWYGTTGTNPVNVQAKLYKAGTMIKGTPNLYRYTNPTATDTFTFFTEGKVITLNSRNAIDSGQRFATFTYTISTGVGIFNNNDTTTPSV